MDLSFSVGCSVNDGIPKDTFLGEPFQLCLPGVEALATLICRCGPNCLIFKKDLHHAYRQFPIDPRDYDYSCCLWHGSRAVILKIEKSQ